MAESDGQEIKNKPTVVNDVASATPETPVEPVEAAPPETPAAAAVEPDAAPAASASSKAKYVHFAVEAILLVAVVILGSQLVSAKSDAKNLQTQLAGVKENPQALVQKQSDDLIAKVATLMKLPAGETPTVAAVSDAAAAKQQSPFFANAANGDKVLLYVKAGEAILYRPSTNKIILVAPLTFNNAAATATTKK